MMSKRGKSSGRRPKLHPGMRVDELRNYYWMKADLVGLARRLGLPTDGYKVELHARIERRLRGLPELSGPPRQPAKAPRDSDQQLRSDTPVVNYKSDQKT